jgi:hypothetical protein
VLFAKGLGTSDVDDNFIIDLFVRTSFPVNNEHNALFFANFGGGIGYNLKIIPNLLMPGLYGDIGINPIMFLIKDSEEEDRPVYMHFGIRLYNQFRFGSFDIEPFAGLSAMVWTSKQKFGWKLAGIKMSYENFGIEYAYGLPFLDPLTDTTNGFHRIAIMKHLR